MASPLLSELAFGSYLAYSPRGSADLSVRSRRIRDAIKAGQEATLADIVQRLAADFDSTGLSDILGPDVTLVPAPRSSLLVQGGLWPPLRIAEALVGAGLATAVLPCMSRTAAVPKSAFQKPGERPNARKHYDTMAVEPELITTGKLTLVDDFVTLGNTMAGGASRLQEVFPKVRVQAFALVRTLGRQSDISRIIDPCVGTITVFGDTANRQP